MRLPSAQPACNIVAVKSSNCSHSAALDARYRLIYIFPRIILRRNFLREKEIVAYYLQENEIVAYCRIAVNQIEQTNLC